MNKALRSLLASLMVCSTALGTVHTDRTFIAHRDELSHAGMAWVTNNHFKPKGGTNSLGARFTATPFYRSSYNETDLAKLFGMGANGDVKVTAGHPAKTDRTTSANAHTALFSFNIDQQPQPVDEDTATPDGIAMSGTLNMKPQRNVWGAYLGWEQSLDSLLKGLRLSVTAPVVEVNTSMKASQTGAIASAPSGTEDGPSGNTIKDFFSGTFSKSIGTYDHVQQNALNKGRISSNHQTTVGVADLDVRLNWACKNWKRFSFDVGASLQIPTGNAPQGTHLLEPIYGARGHVAAGANAAVHIDGFKKGDLHVAFDVLADWKYFFKGTEKRTMGIYDLTNSVMLPGSSYRLVMRHTQAGVQPAANVLTVDHTVSPGHQFEGVAGICTKWRGWTFDVGYNLFWKEKEEVVQKATWSNDRYALAHHRYNMSGVSRSGDSSENDIAVLQHLNVIGTAGQDENGLAADFNLYTSMNGPIQAAGKTTSALMVQEQGANSVTQDDADGGTQPVQYNVSSTNAVTADQMTHSIVGGASYQFTGDYPVLVGLGGQVELQEANRNSALENWTVWAKVGVNF